jgi:hypothetical protein
LWLVALGVVSFAVSWVAANRLRMSRTPYIAVLTVVTVALSIGYVAWVGVDMWDVLTAQWGWGLIVAPLCGAFLIVGMTRLPSVRRLSGRPLGIGLLWEGVVYGIAEGVLLSALPVFMTWQMIYSLGWAGLAGAIVRWTLPILASIVVIVVHHLGYWEYRNRLLGPIALGCGLLSLGYLVTASPIAPTLGHVLGHTSGLLHGAELPPHPHPPVAATRKGTSALAGVGGEHHHREPGQQDPSGGPPDQVPKVPINGVGRL